MARNPLLVATSTSSPCPSVSGMLLTALHHVLRRGPGSVWTYGRTADNISLRPRIVKRKHGARPIRIQAEGSAGGIDVSRVRQRKMLRRLPGQLTARSGQALNMAGRAD